MKESRIDQAIYELEDGWVERHTRQMTGFLEGAYATEQFVKDNPDKPLVMTVKAPDGTQFQVDMTAVVPNVLYQMSFINYRTLVDANQKLEAEAHIAGVKAKWKKP